MTRRLNQSHGAVKLRNLFPSAFEGRPETAAQPAELGPPRTRDYILIGELTVKQARDIDAAEDIAILTGHDVARVRRELDKLHGSTRIRRAFRWYAPDVIGSLTVEIARQYNLALLLASGLELDGEAVFRRLATAPAHARVQTVFPEMDRL